MPLAWLDEANSVPMPGQFGRVLSVSLRACRVVRPLGVRLAQAFSFGSDSCVPPTEKSVRSIDENRSESRLFYGPRPCYFKCAWHLFGLLCPAGCRRAGTQIRKPMTSFCL